MNCVTLSLLCRALAKASQRPPVLRRCATPKQSWRAGLRTFYELRHIIPALQSAREGVPGCACAAQVCDAIAELASGTLRIRLCCCSTTHSCMQDVCHVTVVSK